MSAAFKISFLDYGAGNVRSLKNAIQALGYDMVDITT
jgi:imidazoleglycerol phosphate synthase glutamine amidotransferase subunit HisH